MIWIFPRQVRGWCYWRANVWHSDSHAVGERVQQLLGESEGGISWNERLVSMAREGWCHVEVWCRKTELGMYWCTQFIVLQGKKMDLLLFFSWWNVQIVHMYIWKTTKVIIRKGNGKILNPELTQNSVPSMMFLLVYFGVSSEELLHLISLAPGAPKLSCTFALSGEVRILPSAQGGPSVKERVYLVLWRSHYE